MLGHYPYAFTRARQNPIDCDTSPRRRRRCCNTRLSLIAKGQSNITRKCGSTNCHRRMHILPRCGGVSAICTTRHCLHYAPEEDEDTARITACSLRIVSHSLTWCSHAYSGALSLQPFNQSYLRPLSFYLCMLAYVFNDQAVVREQGRAQLEHCYSYIMRELTIQPG